MNNFSLMSFASASEPLRAANLISGEILYNIRHIPAFGSQAESSNGVIVKASAHIGENVDFDLMIVVADFTVMELENPRVMEWLKHLSKRGVALGGVSGGVVVLARAGLMNGRKLALHRDYAQGLRDSMPLFSVEKSNYVVDRDRYTCVGGTSAIDMMHELISEHHGEKFAIETSEFLIQNKPRRMGNLTHTEIMKTYDVSSNVVVLAIEAMQANLDKPLSLEKIGNVCNVSGRQLNRLFTHNFQCGTIQFYKGLRLDEARKLIENTAMPFAKISLMTGFVSPAHFAKAFKEKFGKQPTLWREDSV